VAALASDLVEQGLALVHAELCRGGGRRDAYGRLEERHVDRLSRQLAVRDLVDHAIAIRVGAGAGAQEVHVGALLGDLRPGLHAEVDAEATLDEPADRRLAALPAERLDDEVGIDALVEEGEVDRLIGLRDDRAATWE